jgi:hypothetical protein
MCQLTDDPPNVVGLTEPDRVLEMVRAIRERAEAELLTLMRECSEIIEAHFSTFMRVIRRRRESSIIRDWWTSVVFRMKDRRWPAIEIGIGVGLDDVPAILTPWIWVSRGGKQLGDRARYVLGDRLDSLPGQVSRACGVQLFTERGIIGLRPVPITLPTQGFIVDRSPLLESLCNCLTAITRDDITALLTDR